jgi:hypothetical protein
MRIVCNISVIDIYVILPLVTTKRMFTLDTARALLVLMR